MYSSKVIKFILRGMDALTAAMLKLQSSRVNWYIQSDSYRTPMSFLPVVLEQMIRSR